VLSDDGSLIALPSGGGNYVPNDLHARQIYGTYLYRPADLDRPVSVLETGPYPCAVGFDVKNDRVYAQGSAFDLIVLRTGGTREHSYRLGKRKTSIGTPVRFVIHPGGGKFLLATDSAVALVEPAVGPAPDAEPTGAATREAPAGTSTSPRPRTK